MICNKVTDAECCRKCKHGKDHERIRGECGRGQCKKVNQLIAVQCKKTDEEKRERGA